MRLPSIGDVVDDKFRVERKLGEGGTSTIYEVRHAITDKKFAIKWLSPELAQNDLAVELFVHEARVCGRFEHPNAVQIYDICQARDTYYMLMEFLEGESLEARLQRVERFSAQAACDILLPCSEALSAAHRVGIVHQDLKPSNIFLCSVEGRAEEVPKVLDFGISNLTHNGYDLSPIASTTTQTVSGTPLYMAPEQMQGQRADPRIDVYALGVVLYELVAGQPPFDSDTFADLVAKIVESQPARLDEVVQVDPAFAEIVARAMAREVEDRFATMAEFADALRPYASQRPSVVIKPVEARRSDAPRPPVRSAWKTTRPGVVVRSDTAAEPDENASDPTPAEEVSRVGEAEAAASPEDTAAELGEAEAAASPEDTAAELGDAEAAASPEDSAAEAAEAEPAESELPADVGGDDEAAGVAAAAEGSLRPPSAIAQPRAAFESGPRVPPITLPPPAAAVSASTTDQFGDGISDEELFAIRPRISKSRWIGVVVALGGALLLTWQSLSGEPRAPAPRPIATPRAALPESDATALRDAPATADMSNRQSDERVSHTAPKVSEPFDSDAKQPEQRDRVVRRASNKAHPPKRSAPAKDNAKPSKRPSTGPELNARIDRAGSSEARSGISLPAAGLSRQDF